MDIYFSLLICLIGLLMWLLSSNAKVSEAGRIMFFSGLLAFLMTNGVTRIVSLAPR